jgi:SAM-dependent methyltransferase
MNDSIKDAMIYQGQFGFQAKYATGKALNVGCNSDGAKFRERGGINIDLFRKDDHTGWDLPVDVQADARRLPFGPNSFDSVVLGEILEHMQTHDAVAAMIEAKSVLKAGGRVVATIPHDDRGGPDNIPEYAPGIAAYHYREITRVEFFDWVKAAGLKLVLWAKIVHVWGKEGTGIVAVSNEVAC